MVLRPPASRIPAARARGLGIATASSLPADAVEAVHDLILTVIEATAGVRIDPSHPWSALQLTELGCPPDLAAELAPLLPRPTTPAELSAALARGDAEMPGEVVGIEALAPTVEISLDEWW